MTIDECFKYLSYVSNKVQGGGIKPSDFNLSAERAQMEYYNKIYDVWQKNQEVTDALKPFLKKGILNVTSTGRVAYPSDYVHTSAVRRNYFRGTKPAIEVDVKELNNDELGSVLSSSIVAPTLRYPAFTYYDTYIQFFPKTVGSIIFEYLRRPVKPEWGYTVSNGRPVYNAATSVDFEFPDECHTSIVFMMASYLGINLSEKELIGYSEAMKSQNV